jgi:lipid-A-disaccharide synthase
LKPIEGQIAVLPGSREQEVSSVLDTVLDVAQALPQNHFVVAGVDNLPRELYQDADRLANVDVRFGHTYEILSHAELAIVTSGTATLEAALFNVPQVVCYRTSTLSYWIGKMVIKVPYISLVNLILDKPAVKELIQDAFSKDGLIYELQQLMKPEIRKHIQNDYSAIRNRLSGKNASIIAAQEVVNSIR